MSAKIAVGRKALDFTLPPRRWRRSVASRLQGPKARALFLSEGRHRRLHDRGQGLFPAGSGLCPGQDGRARRLGRSGEKAGPVQDQARADDPAGLGRNPRDARGLRGLGREIDARPDLHMGILRNTYLIGLDGKIAQIWEKVKVKGHAEEVLAAAKAL